MIPAELLPYIVRELRFAARMRYEMSQRVGRYPSAQARQQALEAAMTALAESAAPVAQEGAP